MNLVMVKDQRLNRIREILWKGRVPITVIVSLAVFGLQAIHSILLARLLGPTGRGEYGTAVFFAQTMTYIGLFGTHYSIARWAASQSATKSASSGRSDYYRTAFRVGVFTGAVSLLVSIGLSWFALPSEKAYLFPMCVICSLLLPAEHLRLTGQSVDHGLGRFNRYNTSRLFAATIFPLLVLCFYLFQYRDLSAIAWSTVLVSITAYLFYWAISEIKSVWKPSEGRAYELIRDGLPDAGLVLANDAYDRLAVYLVIWCASLADQGLFLTALPISTLLLVAPNAFELFAFRSAASESRPLGAYRCAKNMLLIVATQGAVLVALQWILEPLVLMLYGEPFRDAVPVTRILIVAMAFGGLTIVGEGYLRGRRLVRPSIVVRGLATLILLACAITYWSSGSIEWIAKAATFGHAFNAVVVGVFVLRDASRTVSAGSADLPTVPSDGGEG
jgi:antigen flippase